MINLLPSDSKQTLVFARRNTQLMRFIIGLGIGIAGIVAVTALGMFYLHAETNAYKDSVAATKAELKQENEPQTIARVQDISNSLKLVVDVLEQEVLFSKLLRQIGTAMPQGTILQSLSLNNELTGAIDLQAGAVDYQSASQVQVNLEDPNNRIFERADLINIQCKAAESGEPNPYPCSVSIRALFSKDNNFMLVSPEIRR